MSFTDLTPEFSVPNPNQGDTAIPRFYTEPVQNGPKSLAAGHPVFDEMEFVEIHVPGDRKTIWAGRVTDVHRQRFPRQYAAFKQGLEAPTEGFPLDQWPGVTRAQVEELRFAHVKTVEQLAALPDDALTRTIAMGGFALRDKAIRYLEAAKGHAPAEKLAAEVQARDDKIAQMEAQMAAMQAEIARLAAPKPEEPKT